MAKDLLVMVEYNSPTFDVFVNILIQFYRGSARPRYLFEHVYFFVYQVVSH